MTLTPASGCTFYLGTTERGFSGPAGGEDEKWAPAVRIGKLAELTGASVRSLRHYERAGLVDARRDGDGYRVFEGTVECVRRVRGLLDAGFAVS